MIRQKSKKVAVALSGGVDSSVAAALLQRADFDCLGVHMKLSKGNQQAEDRAREVAHILGIPFKVADLQNDFKKKVVDYFVAEYQTGRTPNPCVVCNKEIKFGLLMDWSKRQGFDCLATGHYACVRKSKQGGFKLLRAKDGNKDQTYFLWKLNQRQLSRVLFPIGEIKSKTEVRKLAKQFSLPTYNTEESNDVCFLKDSDVYSFLGDKIQNSKKGDIVDIKGEKLGKHNGLWRYTLGQRKGIGLSGGPYFVVSKDFKKNNLIVSRDEKDLLQKELIAEKVNWVSGIEQKLPLLVKARIRYRSDLAVAVVQEKISAYRYKVIFNKAQRAVTPGQSVVFYLGEELLGGGVIE